MQRLCIWRQIEWWRWSQCPNCTCEPAALSADSQDALEDFKRYLRIMKLESMNEDSFKSILDSLGYQGDSKQLFQELITICSAITGQRVFTLDIGAMRKLYSSLTYTACADKIKTSTNLVGMIANIFGLHNGNDDSLLTDASKISALRVPWKQRGRKSCRKRAQF